MDSRTLRNRISLQQLIAGQDEIGQPTQVWSTFATVWADIRYLQGLETIKGGAETSIKKASIRTRRRTDLTAAMRVLYGATVFQIKAVLPDEQNKDRTDLACEVLSG